MILPDCFTPNGKIYKMKTDELPEPSIFAIFGGTGDLSCRKLIPALFDLYMDKSLNEQFSVIIIGRHELNEEEILQRFWGGIRKFSRHHTNPESEWLQFAKHICYQFGDLGSIENYNLLADKIAQIEKDWNRKAQHIFYMATPPHSFGEIPKFLSEAGLMKDKEKSRIVIEKPIGIDVVSAMKLNNTLSKYSSESQIYRIDHYLGKETVQNILALRFANSIFEPIWNRRYIDHVFITVAEEIGVEHRSIYYDSAGALRDMVQNHLMQLLCLVAMEPMVSFDANEIRNKKVDVLHAIRPLSHDTVDQYTVRGQYGKGIINGKEESGYREEPGIPHDSVTETFVAMKLFVDNWRWQDVPFYIRTGKRLPTKISEIVVQFRSVPHRSFPMESNDNSFASELIISIHPDEGIILRFQAKQPGPKLILKPVDMRFNYKESFSEDIPDAYETLLWDIMKNDATLFMRADQVKAAWEILTPVLEVWSENSPDDFPNYTAGSWGPGSQQNLFDKQWQCWPVPCKLSDNSNKDL
jgi:glucose-6-phosphate 1-dehydrogenase